MTRYSMTRGLLAAVFIVFVTMGTAPSDAAPAQVGIKPELVPQRSLSSDIESPGLPAISADRKEVAVVHYSGDDYQEVSVDILSTSNSKRLKRFALLTESEGRSRTSNAAREALWDKLVAPNQYLTRKSFVSMTPLFEIDRRTNPPQATDRLPAFAHVRYDMDRGDLTITAADDGEILLYFRRPVIDQTGDGPDFPISLTQQVPDAGWVDESSGTAVLRLQTMTRDESTYPVEWVIVNLGSDK